jgi:hypothetical protein
MAEGVCGGPTTDKLVTDGGRLSLVARLVRGGFWPIVRGLGHRDK